MAMEGAGGVGAGSDRGTGASHGGSGDSPPSDPAKKKQKWRVSWSNNSRCWTNAWFGLLSD